MVVFVSFVSIYAIVSIKNVVYRRWIGVGETTLSFNMSGYLTKGLRVVMHYQIGKLYISVKKIGIIALLCKFLEVSALKNVARQREM